MMDFELSPNIDSEKVFLVNLSNLEGYYSPLFFKSKPPKIPHAKRLKDIAIVNPTRPRPKFNDNELVPYVGLPETDENTHSITEVALRLYKEVAGRNVIYPNEILYARIEPSIFNKKYIQTKDLHGYDFAFTSTEFYIVQSGEIDSEYLFYCFLSDYVYNQVVDKTTGSTGRRRLDSNVFQRLLIPIPEEEIRTKVLSIYREAVASNKQKEAQAANLLASIDDYLLKELGIKLPEQDNSLEARIFTINYSEGSSKRFDPIFFYNNFLDEIPKGKYAAELLSNHVNYMLTGFAAGKNEQSESEDGVIQIRPTNIDENRAFKFERNVCISREKLEQRKSDVLLKNEVLFNNTNSQELVGKSVLFDLEGAFFCSNHITRIQTKQSLNSNYLTSILNLYQRQKVFYRLCTNWNNQSGVNTGVLAKLPIPLPPISIQNHIESHINSVRATANQLKQEAKQELEKARLEVERMILES